MKRLVSALLLLIARNAAAAHRSAARGSATRADRCREAERHRPWFRRDCGRHRDRGPPRLQLLAARGHGDDRAPLRHLRRIERQRRRLRAGNPSVVVGGTEITYDSAAKRGTAFGKTNVIAAKATAEGDLRFLTNEQREKVKNAMRAIVAASLPRASATIMFVDEYPAMGPTEGNYALLKILDQASRDLGYGEVPPLEPSKRGAGDISFVAPLLSGLDGLGSRGSGAHTSAEQMDLESLPMLIKRTALLIYRLTR
jgi:acetylornithine deacetylase/succinyl-diaminopimelate desuccinylase-like protein